MAEELTEDQVRDKARDILGFQDAEGVRSGVDQLTAFNNHGASGLRRRDSSRRLCVPQPRQHLGRTYHVSA